MNNQFTYPKEKIRFAILTFFFAQGLCMASWASRIPDFKDVFAANYAFYWGLILFMIPVGKFVAIPLAGYLAIRKGSKWSACMVRQSWQLFMEDGAWEPVPEHLSAS